MAFLKDWDRVLDSPKVGGWTFLLVVCNLLLTIIALVLISGLV